jgi:hypothetical protein
MSEWLNGRIAVDIRDAAPFARPNLTREQYPQRREV